MMDASTIVSTTLGNLMHYEELKTENAKLREELEELKASVFEYEVDELGVYSVFQILTETRQRAEAAEARIKEAEGQEPVAYLNLAVWRRDYSGVFATPEKSFDNQEPLYNRPIPPADVQERSPMFEEVEDILRNRIAELERKLAEQQATVVKLYEMFGKELPNSAEELNGLLAKARAEAVPEGFVSVLIRKTTAEYYATTEVHYPCMRDEVAKACKAAMLAAAPKPGEEK